MSTRKEQLVEKMLKEENKLLGYKLARILYRLGASPLTDAQYDKLHKEMLKRGEPLATQLYDEDELPLDVLQFFNFKAEKVKEMLAQSDSVRLRQNYEKWSEVLKAEESFSISPIESYAEAWSWFSRVQGEIVFSLKVDGINTKNLLSVESGRIKHEISSTRSRSGSGKDITDGVSKMMPNFNEEQAKLFEGQEDHFFVRAECYAPSKGLAELRAKYGKDFKVPRSTALSILQVPIEDKDYQEGKVKLMVFKIPGFDKVTEGLELAKKLGFDVVPHLAMSHLKIPKEERFFKVWLDKILTAFWKIAQDSDISTDGLVVELNDQRAFEQQGQHTGGMYNSGNIALKLGQWEPGVYQSVVTNITSTQNQENTSFVAHFEPVVTDNGITVSKVNVFNADIMIRNNIRPGMAIKFEHKSGTMPSLVYKEN